MSSDEEVFEGSPVNPGRRGNRRKAHNPSPNVFPKKKQREILADVEGNDTMEGQGRSKGGGRAAAQQSKRKRPAVTDSSESSEEDDDEGRSSRASGVENNPPKPSIPVVDDIPEECSQPQNNGEAVVRSRKRLSIRSEGGDRSSSSGPATNENLVASASEVQTIYETCSQMYNANRISPQNAFNLRLLDCINQMINSPNYDKTNMQLTSSTVEIGTKIYVCRVENTHTQVLSLASDISLQQRQKKKQGGGEEGENQGLDGEAPDADDRMDEDEEGSQRRQRQKKKQIRKRGRMVEQDNSKLLTGLEEQNVKFVTRRNFLKKKFNDMIFDDMDFDYLSYFLDVEDENPLQNEEEKVKMKSALKIPDHFFNVNDMGRVDFLPFRYAPDYNPETVDIWGRPLNDAEDLRDHFNHEPQLPVNDEFAYDPAERPAEYPADEAGPAINDSFGNAGFGDDDMAGTDEIPPVSFHDIRSLDHLDEYYQKMRNLLNAGKSKFGWIGPNFTRAKNTWPTQQRQTRRPRQRKEPERVKFVDVDWNLKSSKYVTGQSAKTVFDEKIIEGWSKNKTVVPFLGIEISSNEDQEEFDILDFQNENDPKFIPQIFKLFTSKNRSILDLIKTVDRQRHQSGPQEIPMDDDAFDHENDIELPRDIAGDFCSQPTNEELYLQQEGETPHDAWQFPSSVPGLLNEDPLSLVSGVDSIRFSKKPKPIDMSQLKKAIIRSLCTHLNLEEDTATPIGREEKQIDLAELMLDVLRKLDSRTEKLLSVPIFTVALMHVVADKRLFVLLDPVDPSGRLIVCRGKDFDHTKFIPGLGYEI